MNRIILLMFCLCSEVIIWSYDFQVDNFNFDFDGNSENVILRSQVIPTETVAIPSKISFRGRDFKVAKIGDNAFRNSNLKEVGIREGLISIGDNAFRNTKIDKIVLPNSNKEIGEYAFADCPNLSYVEFGKGIISSRYYRTLRYTFENDDNIEKIVFRGNNPPLNFDYMPFSKMARQFAKIYVPLNGYYTFTDNSSPWQIFFANKIIPYSTKGDKVEVMPYCMYYWDDKKVTNKYTIIGSRNEYNPYTGNVTYPLTLTFEECPDKEGNNMVRISFGGKVSDRDTYISGDGIFYAYLSHEADYTNVVGENWKIIDLDKEPYKRKIDIHFKKVKKPGLFKSKLVDGVEIVITKDNEATKATFLLDNLPSNFNVKFEE